MGAVGDGKETQGSSDRKLTKVTRGRGRFHTCKGTGKS